MSIIRKIWLYSEFPGNKGKPRNNSAAIQPTDHKSIAWLYLQTIKE